MRIPLATSSIVVWVPLCTALIFMISILTGMSLTYLGSSKVSEENSLSQISYVLLSLKYKAEQEAFRSGGSALNHETSIIGTIPAVDDVVVTDDKGIIWASNRYSTRGEPLLGIASYMSEADIRKTQMYKSVQLHYSPDKQLVEATLSFIWPSENEIRSSRRGIIYLKYDLSYDKLHLSEFISHQLVFIGLLGLVLVIFVMALLRNYFVDPIQQLIVQASALAEGNYSKKIEVQGAKEIRTLAKAFVQMRSAISSHIDELDDVRTQLEKRVQLRTAELNSLNLNYRYAQSMAKLGHWSLELSSGLCELSNEAREILGIENSESTGYAKWIFGNVEKEDDKNTELLADLLAHEWEFYDVNYSITVNGEVRYIRMVAERVFDSLFKQVKITGIVQDVTDVKQKELSLLESEAKMRAIVDTAADPIIVIDTQGVIQEFSPSASEVFGYKKSEVLGKNLKILMPEPTRSEHDGYLEKYKKTGIRSVVGNKREVTALRKNGKKFPIDLAVTETKIAGKGYFTAIIRDITQRKEAEEVLLEAMKAAQSATVAKSTFLANMSHEIRTPMNAIVGLCSLMFDTQLSEKQRGYLTKLTRASDGLLNIINDILDISKIESGKLEIDHIPFRLEDVVDLACDIISCRTQEKNIDFHVELSSTVPTGLIGDPVRLGQILINLLGNAVKFTPKKGKIVLKIEVDTLTDTQVILLVSVLDTGIGIAKDKQDKLFSVFTQADISTTREFGGTGLGLAICRNLVSMMGGQIGLESEEGTGSRFFFTVSVTRQQGTPSPRKQIDNPVDKKVYLNQAKLISDTDILLVEDNDINMEIAVELMTGVGLKVVTATNGSEAIIMLNDNPNIGLVLMDCQMPILDGYRATELIRQDGRFKDLPIIALTANVMPEDIKKIELSGMNGLLAKPLNVDKLFQLIFAELSLVKQLPVEQETDSAAVLKSGVNFDLGLKQVNGDIEFYKKMNDKFRTKQYDFAQRFKTLVKQSKFEEAKREAHTLKGQAAYLGCISVSAQAATLEKQTVEQCNWRAIEPEVKKLTELIDNALKEAERYFKANE
ncbi:PAS domain S-box protein [Pseudoalteromonas luteoviolacea]|uniref:PAS domain S-box protein n=1 Tax=Pseudoalteromonas luteoviolacea TaxID=43657 RepID=UPI001153E896|nr:PAS domain S-box protein [Pseudoalteromonas luteoviolacea]TQF70806.1 PAS domain S-box protein [Pseudoalteromonas luteoviolacea]